MKNIHKIFIFLVYFVGLLPSMHTLYGGDFKDRELLFRLPGGNEIKLTVNDGIPLLDLKDRLKALHKSLPHDFAFLVGGEGDDGAIWEEKWSDESKIIGTFIRKALKQNRQFNFIRVIRKAKEPINPYQGPQDRPNIDGLLTLAEGVLWRVTMQTEATTSSSAIQRFKDLHLIAHNLFTTSLYRALLTSEQRTLFDDIARETKQEFLKIKTMLQNHPQVHAEIVNNKALKEFITNESKDLKKSFESATHLNEKINDAKAIDHLTDEWKTFLGIELPFEYIDLKNECLQLLKAQNTPDQERGLLRELRIDTYQPLPLPAPSPSTRQTPPPPAEISLITVGGIGLAIIIAASIILKKSGAWDTFKYEVLKQYDSLENPQIFAQEVSAIQTLNLLKKSISQQVYFKRRWLILRKYKPIDRKRLLEKAMPESNPTNIRPNPSSSQN